MLSRHIFFVLSLILSVFLVSLEGQLRNTVQTFRPPGEHQNLEVLFTGDRTLLSERAVTPVGLTLSPDASIALAVHDNALTVIKTSHPRYARRLPAYKGKLAAPFEDKNEAATSAAIGRNNTIAYLSGGDVGDIILFKVKALRLDTADLHQRSGRRQDVRGQLCGRHSSVKNETRLYILDRFNFRLVILDLSQEVVTHSITVGQFPCGLKISPDETRAYVGVFDSRPSLELEREAKGRNFPTNAFSNEAAGVVSVWTIDLTAYTVIATEKIGEIGRMVEGGDVKDGISTISIAAGKNHVYVSNAVNDNISVLHPQTGQATEIIQLSPDHAIDKCRGLMPLALALNPDESRLYVALGGLNAVAVVGTERFQALGYIPTGRCPTQLKLSTEGNTLYVVSACGYDTGPGTNGVSMKPVEETDSEGVMLGSFETIDLWALDLTETTQQVRDNILAKEN